MIEDALAAIGALWLAAQAVRLIRWRFRVNRDGASGRYRHWTEK